jgi:hypothetical protein
MTTGNGSVALTSQLIVAPPAITLHGQFRRLRAELAKIAASQGSEQMQATLQLGAFIEVLQRDPEIRATNSHQPLLKLLGAMTDVCAGRKPPFLFKAARPPDVVTKSKFASAHLPQGVLVIGYGALVERGRYKPAAARAWFDKELRIHKRPERGADVAGWYRQINAPKGRPAAGLREAFKYYQPELAKLNGAAKAEAFARKCIDAAHGLVGSNSLKLRTKID